MRALALLIGFFVASYCTQSAFALGLFTPLSLDSAAVMPKGVRSVQIAGFTTQAENKFDGSGNIVPLADSFNRSVSWNQLIASRSSAFERGQLKGGLAAEGIDTNSSVGNANGLVNTRITTTVPVFAYGLTDKITLGGGLPIVYANTHVDTGWTASPDFQQKLNMLMTRGYEGKIQAFKGDLNNVVTTKIASYGYQPLQDSQTTDIGDLTLGMKAQIFANEDLQVALAPKVIVPTGRTPDLNKVVDVAPGDGHVDAGLGLIADYNLSSRFILTPSVSYLYQFVNDQAVRIPRTSDESISPDIDWNVHYKAGDITSGALALKYKINDLVTTGLSYTAQYKAADSYDGGAYTPDRYHYLEVDTWQTMQSAELALTASTIPLFRAGVFPVPLEAMIGYSHILGGRNVGMLDLTVLQMSAFF